MADGTAGRIFASQDRVRPRRIAGVHVQIGDKKKPSIYGGKPSVVVDNALNRGFAADAPDNAWVTDITYLRTHEEFACLCVVINLFLRRVVGWAVRSRRTSELAIQALFMAVWWRKPSLGLLIHSDQVRNTPAENGQHFRHEHTDNGMLSLVNIATRQ